MAIVEAVNRCKWQLRGLEMEQKVVVGEAEWGWMMLQAVVAAGGEEEMRRVRCGAAMVARSSRGVGDGFGRKNIAVVGLKVSGEDWLAVAIEEESKAVVKVGWKRLDSSKGRRGRQQWQG
ncbi:hypothetical protein B296_00028535 [Ensete ventricosum]|uniref:Uncharacterized protein n=1 Tax=Ensete ventricosum TaxID=4639 RepID=A0A426ZIP7_ENSVE|nr:hypothetical protein B296_00028535 [Ensete ventricosum]